MTKIDIFSGFLGAGKTTLIKKLLSEAYQGERVVLIENEFGEIGIDGGFLQDVGINVTEMNSGCICCSLVGDFTKALEEVYKTYRPDRILIEPSGVGKLSDVIRAVRAATMEDAVLNALVCVVDAGKCKMYVKNFGEFFGDQLTSATTVILSHTDTAPTAKTEDAVHRVKEMNPTATLVTTPWSVLSGADILSAMEHRDTLADALAELEHHHEHHHHHDEECCHEHHHHHDEECCHEHHHHHDEECSCGCHDHGHHHHHADEVFSSWGVETAKQFTKEQITEILETFADGDDCGMILRAKGIVAATDGTFIHFDYTPGEADVRSGSAIVMGRICVIGSSLVRDKIADLFGITE